MLFLAWPVGEFLMCNIFIFNSDETECYNAVQSDIYTSQICSIRLYLYNSNMQFGLPPAVYRYHFYFDSSKQPSEKRFMRTFLLICADF